MPRAGEHTRVVLFILLPQLLEAMPYRNVAPEGPSLVYKCNTFTSSKWDDVQYTKNVTSSEKRCFGGLEPDQCVAYRWSKTIKGKKARLAKGDCTGHTCEELHKIQLRAMGAKDIALDWQCYTSGGNGAETAYLMRVAHRNYFL